MKKKFLSAILLISFFCTPFCQLHAGIGDIADFVVENCSRLTKILGSVGGTLYFINFAKQKIDEKRNTKAALTVTQRIQNIENLNSEDRFAALEEFNFPEGKVNLGTRVDNIEARVALIEQGQSNQQDQ